MLDADDDFFIATPPPPGPDLTRPSALNRDGNDDLCAFPKSDPEPDFPDPDPWDDDFSRDAFKDDDFDDFEAEAEAERAGAMK